MSRFDRPDATYVQPDPELRDIKYEPYYKAEGKKTLLGHLTGGLVENAKEDLGPIDKWASRKVLPWLTGVNYYDPDKKGQLADIALSYPALAHVFKFTGGPIGKLIANTLAPVKYSSKGKPAITSKTEEMLTNLRHPKYTQTPPVAQQQGIGGSYKSFFKNVYDASIRDIPQGQSMGLGTGIFRRKLGLQSVPEGLQHAKIDPYYIKKATEKLGIPKGTDPNAMKNFIKANPDISKNTGKHIRDTAQKLMIEDLNRFKYVKDFGRPGGLLAFMDDPKNLTPEMVRDIKALNLKKTKGNWYHPQSGQSEIVGNYALQKMPFGKGQSVFRITDDYNWATHGNAPENWGDWALRNYMSAATTPIRVQSDVLMKTGQPFMPLGMASKGLKTGETTSRLKWLDVDPEDVYKEAEDLVGYPINRKVGREQKAWETKKIEDIPDYKPPKGTKDPVFAGDDVDDPLFQIFDERPLGTPQEKFDYNFEHHWRRENPAGTYQDFVKQREQLMNSSVRTQQARKVKERFGGSLEESFSWLDANNIQRQTFNKDVIRGLRNQPITPKQKIAFEKQLKFVEPQYSGLPKFGDFYGGKNFPKIPYENEPLGGLLSRVQRFGAGVRQQGINNDY